ncbi:hypothetical protein DFH07DRAFT_963006 [Mycena maculata]|uniref:Uncharacterized protein n=1 Tax=Mycena maculata TaxID=230809 RepID=A0AAD7ILV4_9AGAR|nr:hypothetical protein DFH07DRAFT_963006 [Mycena maculata]
MPLPSPACFVLRPPRARRADVDAAGCRRLVKRLTNRRFGSIALQQLGTILGANGDMEAAAVGLADAMLPTINIPEVAAKVRSAVLLKFILPICFSHLKRFGNPCNPRTDVVHRYDSRNKRGARAAEKTRRAHTDNEEVQDAKQNLAEAQARLKLAQAEQKSNSSGCLRISRPRKCRRSFDSEQSEEPTDPSETAGFVEDDTSGWGVQRNGVVMSAANYAKNHWDEFKEEYPVYAKAVLSADSDE